MNDATIGHNKPPSPVEALVAELNATCVDLIERANELAGGAERCVVNDDDTAGRATLLVKQLSEAIKAAADRQRGAKEPHRILADAAFNWFKPVLLSLEQSKAKALGKLDAYRRDIEAKAAEVRRIAEEEALRAERAARAAQTLDDAFEAQQRAEAAQAQLTQAPAPEIRSAYGHLATGRKTWDYEVADPNVVPRNFLMVNHEAIKAHIKSRPKDKAPFPIPGINFFEKTQTVVR